MSTITNTRQLIMAAVTDPQLRARFLANPRATAEAMGLSASEVTAVAALDVDRLARRLAAIDTLSSFDPLASDPGHIEDHANGSHDKSDDDLRNALAAVVSNPVVFAEAVKDPRVIRAVVRDSALLRTVLKNDKLLAILKERI